MEKMELSKAFGAYPTMVTPYDENGNVDYAAAEAMVEWYWNMGCDGIFASCQSSEIQCLSEDDRVKLADCVKKKADALAAADSSRAPMLIVASGHVSDDFDDQARELNRIAGTGVDAVILITNRMDIENTGDDAWIRDAERLIQTIPEHVMLGLYECPRPYKRLLTPKMLEWCLSTGRFRYIKDTCCDEAEIERRLAILNGTPLRLFNANAQTLLESLKAGGAGYCGVMCNFHPELYVWLTHHFKDQPETAETVGAFLSIAAFTESLAYPITAKYHLSQIEGLPIASLYSRSRDAADFKPYDAMCVRQMNELANRVYASLNV
ncbi:MAG: dihydrodipicolinate synthase family protein [Clostridia bacterium]|nr:dihydrodipicolinate synthase family protein [Clostridia bacterium]